MSQTQTARRHERRVTLDGIEVLLVRGGVRNYNLRVRQDGTVRLSMPYQGSMQVAEQMVREHRPWIEAQRARWERRQAAGPVAPAPEEVARDKALMAELAPPLVEKYQQLMGVRCTRLRYRRMVSRWGSCNVRTCAITLNTELVHLPRACLESVVVHELCHLLVRPHNADFYALMDAYYPAWREARRILNQNPPRRD